MPRLSGDGILGAVASGSGSAHSADRAYVPAAAQAPAAPRSAHSFARREAAHTPTLPVAAVAKRLGVAPSTLRTWDRRYGLGPSAHTDGRHRRYGPADVTRLELMQRALLRGASTAEAARYALEHLPMAGAPESLEASTQDASGIPWTSAATSLRFEPEGSEAVLATHHSDVAPAVDRPCAGPSRMARRLSAAAIAMDSDGVQRLLAESIGTNGLLTAWRDVIQPVLAGVQSPWRHEKTRAGVSDLASDRSGGAEVAYLFAECVLVALVRASPARSNSGALASTLVGCVPDEHDRLPVHALSAGLANEGIGTHLFGTPLPAKTLTVAVRRSAPAAVVLWARRPALANPRLFARVARAAPRGRLFACGPGWDGADMPSTVELLADVPAAVQRIRYVLLGDGPVTAE